MKSSKIFNLKGGYLMRQKNIKKNNKFNNSCNQNECNNKNLIFSSQFNSCISECNKFKEMANQKCQQAECAIGNAMRSLQTQLRI